MKKLLFLLLCFPLLTLAQQTVGLFSNLPESYNGYTLFNSLGSTNTYLIDNCGVKVYEWNSILNLRHQYIYKKMEIYLKQANWTVLLLVLVVLVVELKY